MSSEPDAAPAGMAASIAARAAAAERRAEQHAEWRAEELRLRESVEGARPALRLACDRIEAALAPVFERPPRAALADLAGGIAGALADYGRAANAHDNLPAVAERDAWLRRHAPREVPVGIAARLRRVEATAVAGAMDPAARGAGELLFVAVSEPDSLESVVRMVLSPPLADGRPALGVLLRLARLLTEPEQWDAVSPGAVWWITPAYPVGPARWAGGADGTRSAVNPDGRRSHVGWLSGRPNLSVHSADSELERALDAAGGAPDVTLRWGNFGDDARPKEVAVPAEVAPVTVGATVTQTGGVIEDDSLKPHAATKPVAVPDYKAILAAVPKKARVTGAIVRLLLGPAGPNPARSKSEIRCEVKREVPDEYQKKPQSSEALRQSICTAGQWLRKMSRETLEIKRNNAGAYSVLPVTGQPSETPKTHTGEA